MRTTVAALVLVATLSAAPHATTCAGPNNIPAGAVVTPECTYIVEQWDPGFWRDNLNQLWTLVEGYSLAIKVAFLGAGGR